MQVGILRRRVVAPDDHFPEIGHVRARLLRQLRERAVVIETNHRRETRGAQARRVLHRDQRIGVRRVADDQHAHVAIRDGVERLALHRENLRVGEQQVLALHARTARPRADEQRCMTILERNLRVVGRNDPVQGRKRAVVQFHHDALQRAKRRRDLEQVQVDRLVGPEHLARGHSEGKRVADLARGAGDGDVDGGLHEGILSVVSDPGALVAGNVPVACVCPGSSILTRCKAGLVGKPPLLPARFVS